MASVSAGGSRAGASPTASEPLAEGLQIDYDGPSGNTELSMQTGDPSTARFEEFEFDDDGRDQSVSTFEISSDWDAERLAPRIGPQIDAAQTSSSIIAR